MEVFIPPQMYRDIALRTNQHAVAQTGKSLLLKNDECEQFFGASLLMSMLMLYQQEAEEVGIKREEMMKFLQFKHALAM